MIGLARRVLAFLAAARRAKRSPPVDEALANRRSVKLNGGNGLSSDRPIVVDASGGVAGVAAQYQYLSSRFGRMDQDWVVTRQLHQSNAQGRIIEAFTIALSDGSKKVVYFDITSFYGRV